MTATLDRPEAAGAAPPPAFPDAEVDPHEPTTGEPLWVDIAIAIVLAAGLLLRFWASSALWLDEALSVSIARLPIGDIPAALRQDGAPPVYYVLLHGWMALVGDSDLAVRGLSGLFSVASLPLMWVAGKRFRDTETAWIAVVLLASSPFALRYATETRMYSMVMFLTLTGLLALDAFLRRPGTWRLAGVMVSAALLMLTHYWGLFLLGSITLVLAIRADRVRPRSRGAWALVGVVVGSMAILPWLPTFLYQLQHTGTPWANKPHLSAIVGTIFTFSGGDEQIAPILGLALMGFGRPRLPRPSAVGPPHPDRPARLGPRPRARDRGGGHARGRHLHGHDHRRWRSRRVNASVILVPFLLLVALGVARHRLRLGPAGVVAALVVGGMAGGVLAANRPRTQAGGDRRGAQRARQPVRPGRCTARTRSPCRWTACSPADRSRPRSRRFASPERGRTGSTTRRASTR